MKKTFSVFLSTLTAVVLLISQFAVESVAANVKLKLDLPKSAIEGEKIQLSLCAGKEGILYGASGNIEFDSDCLSLEKIKTNISGWEFDYKKKGNDIAFACSDTRVKNPAENGKKIITFYFKTEGFSDDGSITVKGKNLKISDGNSLKSIPDISGKIKRTEASEKTEYFEETQDEVYETTLKKGGISDENNNYLKSLIVEDVEFSPEFTPENKKYEATVPFEIKKVNVIAVPQSKLSTVEISGTELKYVGRNIVKVVVLSKSGLKKTYKIYITRLKPDKKPALSNNGISTALIICIAVGAVVIAAAFTVFIILFKKRKRTNK